MTHFGVLVIGEDVEALMSPFAEGYDENTEERSGTWDWWQVGGRWSGRLVLRDGSGADAARKRDIDLDAMRDAAAVQAADTWDGWDEVLRDLPPVWPWDDAAYLAASPDGRSYRDAYRAQPRIVAATLAYPRGWDASDLVEKYQRRSKDAHVLIERLQAVPGYATLVGETWMAPGRMGWFACDDSTDSTLAHYLEAANGAIDAAPPDALFTVVDCHI